MASPAEPEASAERARALKAVLELTEAVERAVRAGEWRAAAALDVERRGWLQSLLTGGTGVQPALREALDDVQSRNAALLVEVAGERRALLEQAASLRRRQHAAATYDDADASDGR